jgi:hypothetical protein
MTKLPLSSKAGRCRIARVYAEWDVAKR